MLEWTCYETREKNQLTHEHTPVITLTLYACSLSVSCWTRTVSWSRRSRSRRTRERCRRCTSTSSCCTATSSTWPPSPTRPRTSRACCRSVEWTAQLPPHVPTWCSNLLAHSDPWDMIHARVFVCLCRAYKYRVLKNELIKNRYISKSKYGWNMIDISFKSDLLFFFCVPLFTVR